MLEVVVGGIQDTGRYTWANGMNLRLSFVRALTLTFLFKNSTEIENIQKDYEIIICKLATINI